MFGMFGRCQLEVLVKLGAADEQGVGQAQRREIRDQRLRLGFGQHQLVDDDDRRALGLGRQRMLAGQEREPSSAGHAHGCERPGREPCRRRGTAEREPNGDGRGPYPSACTSWRRCARFRRGPWPCACPAASWQAASARRAAGCLRADRGRKSRRRVSTLPASLPPSVVTLRSIILLPLRPEPRSWRSADRGRLRRIGRQCRP